MRRESPFPRYLYHVAALAGFTALALLYTYPLLWNFSTRCIGLENDSSVWMWYTWHFRYALTTSHVNPFWTDLIYWPHGVNLLLFHGLFYALVGYVLQPLLGLVGTYNAIMLQTLILSGYFVFLIAEEWGAGRGAAFVAGALYAFAPDVAGLFFSGIGYDHLSRQVIPLFIWALSRAMKLRRLRDSALAAAALCVVWGCDFYFFLNCCLLIPLFYVFYEKPVIVRLVPRDKTAANTAAARIFEAALAASGIWLAWSLRAGQREFHGQGTLKTLLAYVAPYVIFWGLLGLRVAIGRRLEVKLNRDAWRLQSVRPYASTLAFWTVINVPMIVAILRVMRSGDYGTTPSPWRGGGNPTDIGLFLLPSTYSVIWGEWMQKIIPPAPAGCVGWSTVAGVLWLWRTRPQDRWVKLWFCGALFGLIVTMGPWLKVLGFHTYLPLPFYFLHMLPFYNNIQTGYRLEAFGLVFLALLFAVFLREAARTVPARWAPWVPALAFGVLLIEFTPMRLPLYDPAIPAIYERLGLRPAGAILPVPWGAAFDGLGPNGFLGNLFIMPHYQSAHHKPIVGGTIGRVPHRIYDHMKSDPLLQAILAAQSGAESAALLRDPVAIGRLLRKLPVGYVLLDTKLAPAALQTLMTRWPMKLIDEDGTLRLYAVD